MGTSGSAVSRTVHVCIRAATNSDPLKSSLTGSSTGRVLRVAYAVPERDTLCRVLARRQVPPRRARRTLPSTDVAEAIARTQAESLLRGPNTASYTAT